MIRLISQDYYKIFRCRLNLEIVEDRMYVLAMAYGLGQGTLADWDSTTTATI